MKSIMFKLFSVFIALGIVCSSVSVIAAPKDRRQRIEAKAEEAKAKAEVAKAKAEAEDKKPEDKMTIEERRKLIKKLKVEAEALQDWLRAHNQFENLTDIDVDSPENKTSLDAIQEEEKEEARKIEEEKKRKEEELEKEFDKY